MSLWEYRLEGVKVDDVASLSGLTHSEACWHAFADMHAMITDGCASAINVLFSATYSQMWHAAQRPDWEPEDHQHEIGWWEGDVTGPMQTSLIIIRRMRDEDMDAELRKLCEEHGGTSAKD